VVLFLLLVPLFRGACLFLLSLAALIRSCCRRLVLVRGWIRLFLAACLQVVLSGFPPRRCFPSLDFLPRFFAGLSLHIPKSKKKKQKRERLTPPRFFIINKK
jgi:hypothetical protein